MAMKLSPNASRCRSARSRAVFRERPRNTDSGAVLRCWPDGSGLEEFVTGLRNPQELVFDSLGNLFTCDNNSDYGDISRWTFLAPGGDVGWRFAYQYKMKTGPWLREKMWLPYSENAPASQLPVIANIADGPAGLTVFPGTAMGEQFRGKFFVSDFRGDPARSGVRSFRVRPQGAFFTASDLEKPVWGGLTTDVDFGPDGALYVHWQVSPDKDSKLNQNSHHNHRRLFCYRGR